MIYISFLEYHSGSRLKYGDSPGPRVGLALKWEINVQGTMSKHAV